ncbi:MAG: Fpg/Nei family DNA glycosylase [Bacillota bacterium]
MPELPDVEVFRKYMAEQALNKKITSVEVEKQRVLVGVTPQGLGRRVHGHRFVKTRRHGKHLFAYLDDNFWIVSHFGMTGYFKYYKDKDDRPPHTRLLFHFDNGYHLAYVSQRMLGKVEIVEDIEGYLRQQEVGEDALELSYERFHNLIANRRGSAKTTLMNQGLISGIGNIYSDEILFQSGIHPKVRINNLDENSIKILYQQIQKVLTTAIDKMADPKKLPDDYIIPHRELGDKCPKCGGPIKKIKFNNRGTYFCPKCQKK